MGIRFWPSRACGGVVALLVLAAPSGCTRQQDTPHQPTETAPATATAPPATPDTAGPSATEVPNADTPSPYDALPEAVRVLADKPFTGDIDEMVKRRTIRVAVTFNRTHYFIDKGQQRGLTYEALKSFENDLNTDLKTGNLKVHVVIIPMSRDQLYPALSSGKVDMVAAMVTVRPELEALARLLGADTHQREPGRRHRAGRAADRHGGRSGRSGRVRPQDERVLRDPHQV